MWKKLNEEIEKTNIYSTKWFNTVSDNILNSERENVRLAFCSSGHDLSEACRLQNLLYRFDDELSKEHGETKHRMHQVYTENMVGISLMMIKPLSRPR